MGHSHRRIQRGQDLESVRKRKRSRRVAFSSLSYPLSFWSVKTICQNDLSERLRTANTPVGKTGLVADQMAEAAVFLVFCTSIIILASVSSISIADKMYIKKTGYRHHNFSSVADALFSCSVTVLTVCYILLYRFMYSRLDLRTLFWGLRTSCLQHISCPWYVPFLWSYPLCVPSPPYTAANTPVLAAIA